MDDIEVLSAYKVQSFYSANLTMFFSITTNRACFLGFGYKTKW